MNQWVPFALLTKYIWIGPLLRISPATTGYHCTHLQYCFHACMSYTPFSTQQPEWSFINIKQISSPPAENTPMASLYAWNKSKMPRSCMILPIYFTLTLHQPPPLWLCSNHSDLYSVPTHTELVFSTGPLHLLFTLLKIFLCWSHHSCCLLLDMVIEVKEVIAFLLLSLETF